MKAVFRPWRGGLTLLLVVFGCLPVATATPAAAPHPALWKITGPRATIYLFGTIHLLPPDVDWFGGNVATAFTRSDTLVTEILEPAPRDMAAIVAAKALLGPGANLRAMLSAADRTALETALAADHLPPAGLDRFQPWYAAVALATLPIVQLGYDPANGVDVALAARAQALGTRHEALETAEYQLGLFAGLPQPVQKDYLHQVIRELPRLRAELAGIIAAWTIGDAARLARLINSGQDDPLLRRVLLIDRNRAWARWIVAALAAPAVAPRTIFIAVGAGHLAGRGSVIEQLAALGIVARRVQ